MKKFFSTLIAFSLVLTTACSGSDGHVDTPDWPDPGTDEPDKSSKPIYLWVDAAANFPDFANSKENITRDLTLAKETGFTDIVVDVRPTCGDVLFTSSHAQQVEWLGAWVNGVYSKVTRTATWDYLQAFIDEGHKLGLKIHAGFNTMAGGHSTALGNQGVLYRDSQKKDWATSLNLSTGITNTLDYGGTTTKFFNPANADAQAYLISILKDLAAYKDLDGIFLDRCRFDSMESDFSDLTRSEFQKYLGNVSIPKWPEDVLAPGTTTIPSTYPTYFKKWLEFRAKVIHDFVTSAAAAVKSVNSNIAFGVYVGGWYSTYYDVGVNWASPDYNPASTYAWATADYKKYGYADQCDQMLIGAYASPKNVYGSNEWSMQGFCSQAKSKIGKACPIVAGGPDVGNWDADDKVSQADENQAIVNSVKACYDACDGYFLFDMIHLKKANQWQYVKEGINLTLSK